MSECTENVKVRAYGAMVIILILMYGALSIFGVWTESKLIRQRREVEREAVNRGHATWDLDNSGNPKLKWKDKTDE